MSAFAKASRKSARSPASDYLSVGCIRVCGDLGAVSASVSGKNSPNSRLCRLTLARVDWRAKIAQIIAYLLMTNIIDAHIYAHSRVAMPQPETNRNKVVTRLERDGWVGRQGGDHDVFKHPARPVRIIVPRHHTLSPGVARAIAKAAGWQGS